MDCDAIRGRLDVLVGPHTWCGESSPCHYDHAYGHGSLPRFLSEDPSSGCLRSPRDRSRRGGGWDSPGKERDGLALWGAAARLQLRRRRCRDLAHGDGARSQLPGEPEHRRQQNTQRADHGRCVTASVRLRLGVADTARRAGAEVAGRGRAGLEQERVEHGSRGTVVHRARVSEATQIAWPKSRILVAVWSMCTPILPPQRGSCDGVAAGL